MILPHRANPRGCDFRERHGSRRRYAANSCGDVPCAALGANPGQQLVGGRSADQRRAHHCPALSCPDGRAERGLFARRLEQTLICGA
jgi:hypothetical protein